MRKIVIALCGINVVLLIIIILLMKDNLSSEKEKININYTPNQEYLQFLLSRQDYSVNLTFEGQGMPENEVRKESIVLTDSLNLQYKPMSIVKAGEVLYSVEGEEHLAQEDVYVLQSVKTDHEMYLEYMNLNEIRVCADVSKTALTCDLQNEVSVVVNGQVYGASVENIDYLMRGDKVALLLKTKAPILPGEEVQVRIVEKEFKDVIVIPTAFVMKDEEGAYLFTKNADEMEKVYVEMLGTDGDVSLINLDEEYVDGFMFTQNNRID